MTLRRELVIPRRRILRSKFGLCREAIELTAPAGEPDVVTQIISLGNLRELPSFGREARLPGGGSGTSPNRQTALTAARSEAIERYSAAQIRPSQIVLSTAEALGASCINLDGAAQCSTGELSHPRCPVVPYDPTGVMRWIRGVCLHSGEVKLLPVVMAFNGVGVAYPAERFWLSSSTGCAAYSNYTGAVIRALLELIERDAVSILWLQALSLPRLEIDAIPRCLEELCALFDRRSRNLEYIFFDATTDLGVPTVYGIQRNLVSRRLMTVVACATASNTQTALAKVICDLAAVRIVVRGAPHPGSSWDSFTSTTDGAVFMSNEVCLSAFEFLFRSQCVKQLSKLTNMLAGGEEAQLRQILVLLRARGIDAYAIDLTTDEALREGLRVVRVVAPQLQPLSFHYRARFLGTARLYSAPRAMGYLSKPEAELNSWPQPFA
jgi:ribosomal protein S12 methylthiotransferase accessory factor